MSPEGCGLLGDWMEWLPEDPPVEQFNEAMDRFQQGIHPPKTPCTLEWPNDEPGRNSKKKG